MNKPKNIEITSQLLKGVGASAWFNIEKEGDKYRIKRYSQNGKLECSRIFTTTSQDFNIKNEYKFTYISHCKECKIIQNNNIHIFKTLDYEY